MHDGPRWHIVSWLGSRREIEGKEKEKACRGCNRGIGEDNQVYMRGEERESEYIGIIGNIMWW